jgi:hypothetical protein
LARIIEPTSKIDAGQVWSEVGVDSVSYATVPPPRGRLWRGPVVIAWVEPR